MDGFAILKNKPTKCQESDSFLVHFECILGCKFGWILQVCIHFGCKRGCILQFYMHFGVQKLVCFVMLDVFQAGDVGAFCNFGCILGCKCGSILQFLILLGVQIWMHFAISNPFGVQICVHFGVKMWIHFCNFESFLGCKCGGILQFSVNFDVQMRVHFAILDAFWAANVGVIFDTFWSANVCIFCDFGYMLGCKCECLLQLWLHYFLFFVQILCCLPLPGG